MCCLWVSSKFISIFMHKFQSCAFCYYSYLKVCYLKGMSYLRWQIGTILILPSSQMIGQHILCTKFNQVHFAIIPIWKCATHYCTSYLRWFVANWYLSYFAFISNDRSAYLMHKVQSSAFSYYSYLEVCYPLLYFLFKIIHCNWQPFINCLHLEW